MVVALAELPWERPWKRSRPVRPDPIRRVRETLRRIEVHGPSEHSRAELVLAIRRLLAPDFWDGPFSAA
jgi:hypothetical protein